MPTRDKGIPERVQRQIASRVEKAAAEFCPGKFSRVEVRFRGSYCYVDAHEPGREGPTHLFRLGYLGSAESWRFFNYSYASEKYEASFLITGSNSGSPEEALATSTMFL